MNDEEREELLRLIIDYGIEEYFSGMLDAGSSEPMKRLQAIKAFLFPEDQP